MKRAAKIPEIGAKIREIRKVRRMTQSELSHRALVSVTHLSDVERGYSDMPVSMLVKLCMALGADTGAVLNDALKERETAAKRGMNVRKEEEK